MEINTMVATQQSIQNSIFTIRGQQVMLDRDLAVLYGVETKYLNRQVKRNIERFPENFMFHLTQEEVSRCQFVTSNTLGISGGYEIPNGLRCQIGTSNRGGTRYLPYAFTEQGVAMLSAVLRSETAVVMSIKIIEAFVAMRRFIVSNAQMFSRIEAIEHNQLQLTGSVEQHNKQFEEVFKRLDEKAAHPTQGIFYDGQIFDAHTFVCDLIKEAKERIILIDNYLDNTVLTRLAYRKKGLPITIYTKTASNQFLLDIKQHNAQYPGVELRITNKAHDRFLIIDNRIYHLGASIKDLGKKIFAFNLMEEDASELLKRLEE